MEHRVYFYLSETVTFPGSDADLEKCSKDFVSTSKTVIFSKRTLAQILKEIIEN